MSALAAVPIMAMWPDQVPRRQHLRLRVKNFLIQRVAVPDERCVEVGSDLRCRRDLLNRLLRPCRGAGHDEPGAERCDCHCKASHYRSPACQAFVDAPKDSV